jgi:NADH-quinone oxidoreductase subunit L
VPGILWLIPALPLASFLVLALAGSRLTRQAVATVGVAAIALPTAIAILCAARFVVSPPPGGAQVELLWHWIDTDGLRPMIALRLDALSLVMTLVVTFVSLVIHLYSVGHMAGDEGYGRFFAYMNLFVASMATLVLADDLLLLYLGWEGVGLCSYLLIGFWYRDPANGAAARKAFVVTRVGDTALTVGLLMLFTRLGTLRIQEVMARAASGWPVGSALPVLAAALLLGGAVGKSAQLPLQVWLPDAMAGPTPTSALIHAATMVTAGVYLIARTHVLFELAPPVMLAVAIVGAVTLLVAGLSALVQRDIKRILAYSTVSQIGYMFLACGVGAWSAAIFHLVTHAFFKALLFMAAGIVIQALDEEHDIFKMGGLRRRLPVAFWAFLVGGASLAGLPLVTAGFYSKGFIVYGAWAAPGGSPLLWLGGVIGVLLTSLYIFRLIFVVFAGEPGTHAEIGKRPDWTELIGLAVLAVLSVVGGFIDLPPWLGGRAFLTRFLEGTLPVTPEPGHGLTELNSEALVTLAFALGLLAAFYLYRFRRPVADALARSAPGRALHGLWFDDWGFDAAYDRILVRPLVALAHADREDVVDLLYRALGRVTAELNRVIALTETGRLRFYAAWIVLGSVLLLGLAVLFT